MAQVGSTYVDEAYSTIIIENMRPESFLVEGVTYNSAYENGDPKGGVVWFHKIAKDNQGSLAVGGDYTAQDITNSLVPIYIANAFRRSKKLRGVVVSEISANYVDQVASEQGKDLKEDKDLTALASLVYGGTASLDTTAITSANVLASITAEREALRKNCATPTVLAVSPEVYTSMLQAQLSAGGVFTPVTNDKLIEAGVVGKYLGMYVFERPELSNANNNAVVYRDTTTHNVDLSEVDYIIYDSKYFGCVDTFSEARIVASERFAGSLANSEINSGLGVLDAKACIIKKH